MQTYVGLDGKTYTVLGGLVLEVPADVQLRRISAAEAKKGSLWQQFINAVTKSK